MKWFKKFSVLLVVLVTTLVLAACGGSKNVLRVGTPQLSGDFVAGFGSSAYDVYVRDLIHGYGTLVETEEGEFVWDTEVVLAAEPTTEFDEDENKTYTFKLQEDLKWNTGDPITAKNYVANMLLLSSRDWLSIATLATAGRDLLGYFEYHRGLPTGQEPVMVDLLDEEGNPVKDDDGEVVKVEKLVQAVDEDGEPVVDEDGNPVYVQEVDEDGEPVFDEDGNPVYKVAMQDVFDPNYTVLDVEWASVRLLGEYEFSLTIDAANLPYFYEVISVSASPLPLQTYLPGFDVKDDGDGAYITKVDSSAKSIRETVAETVNAVDTGQRFKPTVTAGPYQFVSFVNDTATVEFNPQYKGNYEGKRPTIERIEITYVATDVDVDQVIAGTIDLVSGVIDGNKIEEAREADSSDLHSYFRNGYGMMAFAQYWGPSAHAEVRRGVAYLIDRNIFLTQFLGGYGSIVDGPYGEAQWFFQERRNELNERLTNYTLDVDKANDEFDASPYKFEEDGVTPWDPAKAVEPSGNTHYYRYNAEGERLTINHLSASADVGNLINISLSENGWQAGLEFIFTNTDDFDLLLNHYYYGSSLDESELTYHSFNLASNFYSNYDPYMTWSSEYAGTTNNPGMTMDDVIDEVTHNMRRLNPEQKEEFADLFVDFVERWNEILPNIPLYSNEYFDVYNTRISGLGSTPVWSWANDIADIRISGFEDVVLEWADLAE